MNNQFTLTRNGSEYTAEFMGCKESADTPIEAIEKAHEKAHEKARGKV